MGKLEELTQYLQNLCLKVDINTITKFILEYYYIIVSTYSTKELKFLVCGNHSTTNISEYVYWLLNIDAQMEIPQTISL